MHEEDVRAPGASAAGPAPPPTGRGPRWRSTRSSSARCSATRPPIEWPSRPIGTPGYFASICSRASRVSASGLWSAPVPAADGIAHGRHGDLPGPASATAAGERHHAQHGDPARGARDGGCATCHRAVRGRRRAAGRPAAARAVGVRARGPPSGCAGSVGVVRSRGLPGCHDATRVDWTPVDVRVADPTPRPSSGLPEGAEARELGSRGRGWGWEMRGRHTRAALRRRWCGSS